MRPWIVFSLAFAFFVWSLPQDWRACVVGTIGIVIMGFMPSPRPASVAENDRASRDLAQRW